MSFLWNELFFKPIFNVLILLLTILPGMNLGVAIIALTLIIRTILFFPMRSSLKTQAGMQEIQPKIAELKKKHKDNPQRLSEETMKLYKEHGVNPCGSCLPLLIQMPFLIAVFRVLRLDLSGDVGYLLYPFLSHVDFTQINIHFLWIKDLTESKDIVLALMVGLAQFVSMWLMQANSKKMKEKMSKGKPLKKKKNQDVPDQMEMMSKSMTYMMPFMIGYFAYTYPPGLGIYWFVSTVFGIVQQYYLNKQRAALMDNKQ